MRTQRLPKNVQLLDAGIGQRTAKGWTVVIGDSYRRTVASVAFRLNGHLRDACLRPRFGAEPLSPGKSIPSAVPGFRLANQSGYSSVRSFSRLRVWLTLLFLPVAINEGQHLKDIRIS